MTRSNPVSDPGRGRDDPSPDARDASASRVLLLVGGVSALLWGLLAGMTRGLPVPWLRRFEALTGGLWSGAIHRMGNGFSYDLPNDAMPTAAYLILQTVLFGLMLIAFTRLRRVPASRRDLGMVIGFAVLFRVLLIPAEMIHENDIYRYLWDGKVLRHGINPYKYAPSDLHMFEMGFTDDRYVPLEGVVYPGRRFTPREEQELSRLLILRNRDRRAFERIGHKQVPTIYPPSAQALFAVLAWIREDSVLFYKTVFVIFDGGVILLIIGFLRRLGRNPAEVLLYAWSPLILKEYADSGHYDPWAVFLTLAALRSVLDGRRMRAAVGLAAAALSKFFAILLWPVLWRRVRWEGALLFAGAVAAAYVPFVLLDETSPIQVFNGLSTYGREWVYNASLFAVVRALLGRIAPAWGEDLIPAKVVCGLLYLGWLAWICRRPAADDRVLLGRAFMAVGGLFLFNPMGAPWYYGWVMPFVCLFPRPSWILLSGLLPLSYLNFRSDVSWIHLTFGGIPLLNWVIYLPFFLLLAWEERRGVWARRTVS